MRGIALVIVFLALPLIAGCPPPIEPSADVNQDAIIQEYLAEYDGETDRSTVEAQFWFGVNGTTLELTPPSRVRHGEIALHLVTSDGAYYIGATDGFVGIHQWVWTTTELQEYVNAVVVVTISFVEPPERIPRAGPAVFEFEPPLEGDEVASIRDVDDNYHFWFAHGGGSGRTGVALTSADLDEVSSSRTSLWIELERSRTLPLQEATSRGGEIQCVSTSEHIKVLLDP